MFATAVALSIVLSTTAVHALGEPFVVRRFGEPTAHGSAPTRFAELDVNALFLAETESTGLALWRSDGTESGTSFVVDFSPGVADAFGGDSITRSVRALPDARR